MNKEEFDRLYALSEKSMVDILTHNEINEFRLLLNLWNDNLFKLSYAANTTD